MKPLLRTLTLLAAFAPSLSVQAQVSSSDKWWTYIADYEGIPGSTRVDMGQRDAAPLPTLPYVVIAGVQYDTELSSGFPDQAKLAHLNDLSDKIVEAILNTGPSLYVGTFTHKRQQEHYVYVRSLAGTEEAFRTAIARACPECKPLFRTKDDPKWDTYLKFLYPNRATMDYYGYDARRTRRYRE